MHSGPGAFIVGPCRQAEWWHGAVAVELVGGECLGLGLVLPGACISIVRPSSCLAVGRTEIVGSKLASLGLGVLVRWSALRVKH